MEDLIAGILATTHVDGAEQISAWKKPGEDIHRLVRHNYARSLRRNLRTNRLGPYCLPSMKFLPTLQHGADRNDVCGAVRGNRNRNARSFHRRRPMRAEEGLALRGFMWSSRRVCLSVR
jgi:hypothetical protein